LVSAAQEIAGFALSINCRFSAVHRGKWDSQNLTLIIETLKTVLHEIYVVPDDRSKRSTRIQELLQQVRGGGKGKPEVAPTGGK